MRSRTDVRLRFGNAKKTKFFINGRPFDENRNDVTVRLGDTEEWTIPNEDTQYHTFTFTRLDFS